MKKTMMSSLLLVSMSLLFGKGATAQTYADDLNAESDATVTFEDGGGTTEIVDPTDPTKPIDPDPGIINPGTGALRITYVSDIVFGKQKVSNAGKYYAENDKKFKDQDGNRLTLPNFVAVQDNRVSADGFRLTVSQAGQLNDGTSDLTGAELSFKNLTQANNSNGVNLPNSAIKLNPNGTEVNVVTAAAGNGSGSSSIGFGKDVTEGEQSVELLVPSGTSKSKNEYSTKLNWTLNAAP